MDDTGLMDPDAETESLNSPRVTNVVLGITVVFWPCPPWHIGKINNVTRRTKTPAAIPALISFFYDELCGDEARLSLPLRASASSSLSPGEMTPIWGPKLAV